MGEHFAKRIRMRNSIGNTFSGIPSLYSTPTNTLENAPNVKDNPDQRVLLQTSYKLIGDFFWSNGASFRRGKTEKMSQD